MPHLEINLEAELDSHSHLFVIIVISRSSASAGIGGSEGLSSSIIRCAVAEATSTISCLSNNGAS